ncbi:Signal transduction histidine kinase [Bacillus cereus]|nr:Signal transduction histidine kinase [Bacillus cereus]
MDIRATLGTGEHVNIEIQLANKHDMQKHSLYYWSKLYVSQMQEGMSYSELQKAITVNVLDFVLYPNYENFQTMGILWNRNSVSMRTLKFIISNCQSFL